MHAIMNNTIPKPSLGLFSSSEPDKKPENNWENM